MTTTNVKLELDVPYNILEEPGWSKSRLIRDVDVSQKINPGANLIIEPVTGTLMLKPKNFERAPGAGLKPGDWEPLSKFTHAAGLWTDKPVPSLYSITPAKKDPSADMNMLISLANPATLLSSLILVAAEALLVAHNAVLKPVLVSTDDYAINQGFSVVLAAQQPPWFQRQDYIGITFGDFFLSLSTAGEFNLYWSRDGSNTTNSYVWKRRIGEKPLDPTKASLKGPQARAQTWYQIDILPFGRGNIWFRVNAGGSKFEEVYSHKEAEWNPGEGRYRITKAGPVGCYINTNYPQNVRICIAKMKFPTNSVFWDEVLGMPYSPSTHPTVVPFWTKTMGSPTLTASVRDETGDPWDTGNPQRKCRLRVELTGDGTTTPFYDGAHLVFPQVVRQHDPGLKVIPSTAIETIQFTEGLDWADSNVRIRVNDRTIPKDLINLLDRSEVTGRLVVNDIPCGLWQFEQIYGTLRNSSKGNVINLEGKNLGYARVKEKTFFWPTSYGNLTHPDAVKFILGLCGFTQAEIDADTDTVVIPETNREGQGTDEESGEFRAQPQLNMPVESYLDYIINNLSGWHLLYLPVGKWTYKRTAFPTTAAHTFRSQSNTGDPRLRLPFATDIEFHVEPPEANAVYLIGKEDGGQIIGNTAIDWDSINAPHSKNYVGRIKPVVIIDFAIPTQAALDSILEVIFERVRTRILRYNWRGPFIPGIKPGDGVYLEPVGKILMLESYTVDAGSGKQLLNWESTRYTGVIYDK